MPGESGQAFIDRMLRKLDAKKGSAPALPTPPTIEITATSTTVAKEAKGRPARRVRAAVDPDPVAVPGSDAGPALAPTKHWPPLPGKRYSGPWPPAALRFKAPAYKPGPHLPLDQAQMEWLARYTDIYPGQCNPRQKLTAKEAAAREAAAMKAG
jgi:hypothetical protein